MLKKIRESILAKNIFIYMFANIINKVIPFVTLPILTIYISPSDFGIVSTFSALTAIIAIFIRIGTTSLVNINFFKMSKNELSILIANIIILVLKTSLVVCILIYFFQDKLSVKLNLPILWVYISLVLAFMRFIISINLILWQVEKNSKAFAIFEIALMLITTCLALFFVIYYDLRWVGILVSQLLATFFFFLISIYSINERKYFKLEFNKKYIFEILSFGVPLLPHTVSNWIRTGADRILITTLVGTSATGLYSIGFQFGFIVGIVATAFNQAFSPYLYNKLKKISKFEKIKLVKWTYVYFFGLLIFATFISFVMPIIIEYFLDKRYMRSNEFIPWIAFGFAFQGMWMMVSNYVYYMKKTFKLSMVSIIASSFHIFLSYMLIKENGALGAAQASTISFFIAFVLIWLLSAKYYPMPWLLRKDSFEKN